MMSASRILLFLTTCNLAFDPCSLNRLWSQTPPVSQQQLADEVKTLRKELYQDLFERQIEKVEALEQDLDRVRREGSRIDSTLQSQEEEMAAWRQELQTSELSPQERAQAETAKRDANTEAAQQFRTKRAAAAAREATLVQRLSREKDRLRGLRDALHGAPR